MVFLAWLNGFQDHFVTLGGAQAMRPLPYFVDVFKSADSCSGSRTSRSNGWANDLRSTVFEVPAMRDFTDDHSALALNTATLGHMIDDAGAGWTPEQVIDGCAERGYGAITWWRRELGDRAYEIGRRTRDAGLAISGLCRSPFLVGPMAPPDRQAVLDEFKAAIDCAGELGAPCLTVVVGGVEPETRGLELSLARVRDVIANAVPWATAAGVKLALEPLHPVYGGNRSCLVSLRDAVDLCQAIGDPQVSIAVDVYHVWWDTSLAAELQRAGGARIAGYHVCDWLAETKDVLFDRGMMGDGVADLRAIRQAVEATGYQGYCEVEIFSAENWWRRDPADVLDTAAARFRAFC